MASRFKRTRFMEHRESEENLKITKGERDTILGKC